MRLYKKICPFIVIAIMISCVKKNETLLEPVKDLNALWKIESVTRNETDITKFIDSSGFKLTLSPDKTYTLEGNNIPFIVDASTGTWSIDDPQYPYKITFKPKDSTSTFSGDVATPVTKGNRTLNITFSPGCQANSYTYIFEKVQ
ncbi:MAG: DUF5004 domain-containing protein [Ginsengibacter sp.]